MTDKISKNVSRLALCAAPLVLAWNVATVPARAQDAPAPAATQTQTQNDQTFSQAQIAQLVAPIALYPDPLLTQILMSSTYPLEVVEAARWSHDNPSVKGQALETAMQNQSWDPSVKALTSVPQTLEMMSDKIDWTQQLGDAFLAQQQDVLNAVQQLRAEAQGAGNLKSTPQQVVTTAPAPAADCYRAGQSRRLLRPGLQPGRGLWRMGLSGLPAVLLVAARIRRQQHRLLCRRRSRRRIDLGRLRLVEPQRHH
jgi:hypothetical protein